MKVALVGPGAFGRKHLDGLRHIDGADCTWLVGADADETGRVADTYGIARATTELAEALESPELDAVILATPTPLHARQAIACLHAGKHVQVEIPLAASLADAEAVLEAQRRTGLIAMCGHTRRFNPSHQWLHQRLRGGALRLQQLNVRTHFMRRQNTNAAGEPRSWTDHLLWHHAAHTVDLFAYQAGEAVVQAQALAGPQHPELGIAMDMGIQLKTASGKLCTLSLSFNNEGPFGSFFRYICDRGTFVARYDELRDGADRLIDTAAIADRADGIELQDREFFAAIRARRAPNAAVSQVLPCYRVLHALEAQLQE